MNSMAVTPSRQCHRRRTQSTSGLDRQCDDVVEELVVWAAMERRREREFLLKLRSGSDDRHHLAKARWTVRWVMKNLLSRRVHSASAPRGRWQKHTSRRRRRFTVEVMVLMLCWRRRRRAATSPGP